MKTEKRKAQQREASKKNWKDKKAAGWKKISVWIRPDWKKEILEILEKLKSKPSN